MSIDGWSRYWQATVEAAAFQAGAPQETVLAAFWTTLFENILPGYSRPRLLDLGCGGGALLRYLPASHHTPVGGSASLVGADRSFAALLQLRQRFPAVAAVAADARQAPFRDAEFDLVASQFGVEYAGRDALGEAARLVADRGVLAAILHLKGGGIYVECENNLRAITRVRKSRFLELAEQLFVSDAGPVRRERPEDALRPIRDAFRASVEEVERVLQDHGNDVAGGFVRRLYSDIAHMHQRITAYDAREVTAWLAQMAGEMEAYVARTSAMLEVAASESDLDRMLRPVAERGLTVRVRDTLKSGVRREPAAWVIVCDRR